MIEINTLFPVLVTENLAALQDFYTQHFGFQAVFFDADFYLHLLHPGSGTQLGFLVPNHPSQPDFLQPLASQNGMVISFEVMDIQSALNSAKEKALSIAMPYKEESWGQAHFMVRDPAGFIVDIIQHTESQS